VAQNPQQSQQQFLFPNSRGANQSVISFLAQTPERKCSMYCNHLGGPEHPVKAPSKSKRQLLEEQERKTMLKLKIKCK
jgi:hypothetical protein